MSTANKNERPTVVISEELLDAFVSALATLPYQDVQPLFVRMAHELQDQHDEPSIVTR